MREEIQVNYELNIIGVEGEFTEEFSHVFDSSLYNSDIEGTDFMMVNFKVQELRNTHGDVFLLEFSVNRGGVMQ